MSTSAEEWLKHFKAAEKELLKTLAQKDPTFSDIDALLNKVRSCFENLIFASLDLATSHEAETRLWDYHGKVNSRYRRQLAKFHDEEGKKKPVEKRKLEKHYLDFIKSSMRFYRGYIQRSASVYGDIPELSQIASRFKMNTTSIDVPIVPSAATRAVILKSCHATLVHLGDLSRYRETELKASERNWGPAIGYYDLATFVNPSSGLPHNQLAVIALADGNHFRALYQLYRAQTVQIPHPSAKNNLDIEFKKIIQLKAKDELFPRTGTLLAERTVEAWFSYLHAMCEKGEEWPEHEDIENELLGQMSVLLKEKSLESQLQRFSLINMAAEYMAGQQARESTSSEISLARFQFYQRLNLKTFFMLLQILLPELAREDEVAGLSEPGDLSNRLSSITRRILPSLRHYSSWLLTNVSFLVAQGNDPFLGVHIREFWKIYANALTLLAGTFPVKDLPVIEYLLEEDEDTIGFLPISNENTIWRYHGQPDCLKPRYGEENTPKELPQVEMLFRIRDFIANGVELTTQPSDFTTKSIPIELVQGARFVYQEEGLPRELHSSSPDQPPRAPNREEIERDRLAKGTVHSAHSRIDDERSTAASTSNNTMANMVNRLVDSDTPMSYNSPPNLLSPFPEAPLMATSNTIPPSQHSPTTTSNNPTLTARDIVKSMTQSQPHQHPQPPEESIRPLSASIWTPLPGETSGSSPQTRPGTSHRHNSPAAASAMTPLALPPHPTSTPSSSFFHDQLAKQHHALHGRESSLSPLVAGAQGTPSSWLTPSPYQQENVNPGFDAYGSYSVHGGGGGVAGSMRQMATSPWAQAPQHLSSSLMPSPIGSSPWKKSQKGEEEEEEDDVVVVGEEGLRLERGVGAFGAIGQTPPSGQGG